jgi:hypothetical protein
MDSCSWSDIGGCINNAIGYLTSWVCGYDTGFKGVNIPEVAQGYSYYFYERFGPGCGLTAQQTVPINLLEAHAAANNTMYALANALNQTNSEAANLNATFQELLSYYENRAEAIVASPFILNQTWNASLADQVAIDSGLVPSIEGVELAIAEQEYQDWNMTASNWNQAFGSGGLYPTSAGYAAWFELPDVYGNGSYLWSELAADGSDIQAHVPWEIWTSPSTMNSNDIYFNMVPGGTIVNANWTGEGVPASDVFNNYTVYDLTQGTQFNVPHVSYLNWTSGNYPIVSKLYNVGQFDLLKLACTGYCSARITLNQTIETSGAYAFENATPMYSGTAASEDGYNSMIPQIQLSNTNNSTALVPLPYSNGGHVSACIILGALGSVNASSPCTTELVPTGGTSKEMSSGAGQVVGGNASLWSYAETAQRLVNNTLTMAYDYWLTLRAITDGGRYNIPANCAIPTPSDAFPAATDFRNYMLSANNVEAVYLAYLNAIAREYGEVFTTSTGFCEDPNLGFSFNWTGSWALALNISASIYIGTSESTPLFLNGSVDPNATYANVSSWPVYHVGPTLLYPFEYQMNVPINTTYPVPINDPLSGILVNYKNNLDYGLSGFSPAWGIPTYVSLLGGGNYISVSGNLTNIGSGEVNASGDAIYIHSCYYEGIRQTSSCNISVTYFNTFTIGLIHAIVPPHNPYLNTQQQQAQKICGTGAMNQWYDAWAGLIITGVASVFVDVGNAASSLPVVGGVFQTFFTDLGCLVGYIVLILLVVFVAMLCLWIYRKARE